MKHNLRLFKIAKLAKEKGFTTHTITTKFTNDYLLGGKNMMINETCILLWLCELQKWLREIHKIIVLVDWEGTDGYFYKLDFKSFYEVAGNNNKNYEDCLELGLQEALKLI